MMSARDEDSTSEIKPVTQTESLYGEALALASKLDENFVDLARKLSEMLEDKPDDFQKFVVTSKLGKRKCYYLVAIDKAFRKTGVPKERLRKLGWTKANVLSKFIDKTNAKDMMVLAEQNTARNLEKLLKNQKPKDEKVLVVYYDEADYDVMSKALQLFGAEASGRGLANKEKALLAMMRKAVRALANEKNGKAD